jgi:hypothetical protein
MKPFTDAGRRGATSLPGKIDVGNSGLPPWIGQALETRQAQALVRGRGRQAGGKAEIPGLEGFARAAARVHNAAAAGDPRAAAALPQIKAALADAQAAVQAEIRLMAGLLDRAPDGAAAQASAARLARVPPPPANPYAHLGACLLADFDRLASAILAARLAEAIDRRRAYALLFEAGRPVRHAFSRPAAVWRRARAVRADARKNTQKARTGIKNSFRPRLRGQFKEVAAWQRH